MHAGVTFKSRPFYFNNMQAFPVFILAWLIFFLSSFFVLPDRLPQLHELECGNPIQVRVFDRVLSRKKSYFSCNSSNQSVLFFIIKCQCVQEFLIVYEFQTRKSKFVATDISLDEKSRALLPSIYTFVIRHNDATRSYNNNRNSWFKIALRPLSRL